MSNKLSTEELAHEIEEIDSIRELKACLLYQDESFCGNMFSKTLSSLWENSGFTKQKMSEISHLNASYVYDLFGGRKQPSRDTVFRLALTLAASVEECNRLLLHAGLANIYPRVRREAIIKFGILQKKGLQKTNNLLLELGEDVLYKIE